MYLLQLVLFLFLHTGETTPRETINPTVTTIEIASPFTEFYSELGLESALSESVFTHAMKGVDQYNPEKKFLAIADFSQPSTKKRLFIIDLINRKLVLNTFVAHGKNSGELMATTFSNKPQSLMSSPGFYRVSNVIQSPKHGEALLLDGLEKGINDNARRREIIIHGARYVCEDFIRNTGRLGRSYGCPAVPAHEMHLVSDLLAGGSLLFIFSPAAVKFLN